MSERWRDHALPAGALALGLAGLVVPKLGLPAAGLAIVAVVATSGRPGAARWLGWAALVVATAASLRFLVREALPGITQGGTRAAHQAAVSRLREILFAEDAFRRHAFIDPDGDRVGSAALLDELTGARQARGAMPPPGSVLAVHYTPTVETPLGPATAIAGYLHLVCVPAPGGGFTARPVDAVDAEAGERRYFALAWPAAADLGLTEAFILDQHERIWVSENREGAGLRWAGPSYPPPCDAAVSAAWAGQFAPWRGKAARPSLPGDVGTAR